MRAIYDMVARVADSPSTVLITGESGTGKELIAKALHRGSLAPRQAVHQGELRGDPEGPGRERAVRLRARRVHRRASSRSRAGSSSPTAARCSSTRSARCRVEMQVEAAARAPGAASSSASAASRRSASTCASSPRPTATSKQMIARRPVPRGPLLPAQRRPDRPARRCASARRTSRCSSRHFIEKSTSGCGKKVEGIERRRARAARCGYAWPGNIRELENLMERVGAVRRRAAHPGERAARLAPRARRPPAGAHRGDGPARRHRRAERRVDEGDRPARAGASSSASSSPARSRRPAATSPARRSGSRSAASRCRSR